jgi:hypothetical protein
MALARELELLGANVEIQVSDDCLSCELS